VTFVLDDLYLKARGFYVFYNQIPLDGDVCALDKSFRIRVNGQNPSGGKYEGTITFKPTSKKAGSWTHSATTCEPGGKCAMIQSNGTYAIETGAGEKQTVTVNAAKESMAIPRVGGKGFNVPSWQFDLEPATGSCVPYSVD
jgi:hypothetical protein